MKAKTLFYKTILAFFDLKYVVFKFLRERRNPTIHQLRFKIKRIRAKLITNFFFQPTTFHINGGGDASVTFIINLYERLGDIIAAEPIARLLKSNFPKCKIKWCVKTEYTVLLRNNPFIDSIIEVRNLPEVDRICEQEQLEGSLLIDCLFNGRPDNKLEYIHINKANPKITCHNYFTYGGLLEAFCLSAKIPPIKTRPKIWATVASSSQIDAIKNQSANRPIVAIHCESSIPYKNYSKKKWLFIVHTLISKGYCVIEIGLNSHIESSDSYFINATNKNLSLIESFKILSFSNYFIGIDSSFAHAANSLDIPSIILLGRYANFVEYSPFSNQSRNRIELRNLNGCTANIEPNDIMSAFEYLVTRQRLTQNRMQEHQIIPES